MDTGRGPAARSRSTSPPTRRPRSSSAPTTPGGWPSRPDVVPGHARQGGFEAPPRAIERVARPLQQAVRVEPLLDGLVAFRRVAAGAGAPLRRLEVEVLRDDKARPMAAQVDAPHRFAVVPL